MCCCRYQVRERGKESRSKIKKRSLAKATLEEGKKKMRASLNATWCRGDEKEKVERTLFSGKGKGG